MSQSQQYVLIGSVSTERGLDRSVSSSLASLHQHFISNARRVVVAEAPRRKIRYKVVDSVGETGPKLIEAAPEDLPLLRAAEPGIQILPVKKFQLALASRPVPISAPKLSGVTTVPKIQVRVVSASDQKPIKSADIRAFTDFSAGKGLQQSTDEQGEAGFDFGAASKKIERLYVFPPLGFWPRLDQNISIRSGQVIALTPIQLTEPDALRSIYRNFQPEVGSKVRVAVIDSGVGPHPDLQVEGGACTLPGDKSRDFKDFHPQGHGTHVAGIIAARGMPPTGLLGLASGVTLRAYRVVPEGEHEASNYAISKAIDQAVADGCDLLNLSISGTEEDSAVRQSIADARRAGRVVIAAAGNDGRKPVGFPASDSLVVAVSAMGHSGCFPGNAAQVADIAPPSGKQPAEFIAAFSNVGEDIDFTAPGVGIVSTVPGGYAVLDGTSMACPAVTGAAARLLATHPEIYRMKLNEERSASIVRMLCGAASSRGFGALYEGQGLVIC